ncbi:hypothetical protein WB44_05850 [Synechococcus sp. WH 8020]|nr:hypothetical protein WB44_05850 [Synechococcus sp. WH 8020]
MGVLFWLAPCTAVFAESYWCEGDLLTAERTNLGQEAIGTVLEPIPNSSDGTVPGDGIVLHWRDLNLQLPRTNNAGPPSYTDGRWWWRVEDVDHPEFRQRKASIETYSCVAQLEGANPLNNKNS